MGPLQAAGQSCARRRSRRLGGERRIAKETREKNKKGKEEKKKNKFQKVVLSFGVRGQKLNQE